MRWKDILDVRCTDRGTLAAYRCIEEDNFDCKLQAFPLSPRRFLKRRKSAGVPSLHRFRL